MPQWLWGFLSAAALAVIGWSLSRLQRRLEKHGEQREAAAALRFELESNHGWLDDILESRNYLRDEAWVAMKNKGYISYLRSPIPLMVITTYNQLHRLNEQIRVLKETKQREIKFNARKAMVDRELLRGSISSLIVQMDASYPEIGKNFKKSSEGHAVGHPPMPSLRMKPLKALKKQ